MDSWILGRAAWVPMFAVTTIWIHILADVGFDISIRFDIQCPLKTIQHNSSETQHIRQQLDSPFTPTRSAQDQPRGSAEAL